MSLLATSIIGGVTNLITAWFKKGEAKQQAEAAQLKRQSEAESNWDLEAQKASRYSWKDEFITIVWFAPLIMAWYDPVKANAWVKFVGELPPWYQIGMFGIISASFGLRWFFKQQNFKVTKA